MNGQEFIDNHPALLVVLFSIFFVFMWCLVVAIISFISGWFELSKRFRLVNRFEGASDGMQSGQMRWHANYRNCLTLGANQEGLYLATMFLVRFMHPPLLVPWSQIRVSRKQRWLLGVSVTLTLGRELAIPLRISGRSATLLRDAAREIWPIEET